MTDPDMDCSLGDAENYVGQYVRTDNPERFNCGRPKSLGLCVESCPHCGPDDVFGGEGLAVRTFEENGGTWLEVDYGYAWQIDPPTVVTIINRCTHGPMCQWCPRTENVEISNETF